MKDVWNILFYFIFIFNSNIYKFSSSSTAFLSEFILTSFPTQYCCALCPLGPVRAAPCPCPAAGRVEPCALLHRERAPGHIQAACDATLKVSLLTDDMDTQQGHRCRRWYFQQTKHRQLLEVTSPPDRQTHPFSSTSHYQMVI